MDCTVDVKVKTLVTYSGLTDFNPKVCYPVFVFVFVVFNNLFHRPSDYSEGSNRTATHF
jgi:hypothetical protein